MLVRPYVCSRVLLGVVQHMAAFVPCKYRHMVLHVHGDVWVLPMQGLVGVGIGAAVMGGLALVVGGIVASRR